uniref:Uncharacterized protein n=1 Tax=Anguilla anguilla TaxID=7936 RepID=A0A0E9S591_ANGAN
MLPLTLLSSCACSLWPYNSTVSDSCCQSKTKLTNWGRGCSSNTSYGPISFL